MTWHCITTTYPTLQYNTIGCKTKQSGTMQIIGIEHKPWYAKAKHTITKQSIVRCMAIQYVGLHCVPFHNKTEHGVTLHTITCP